MSIWVNQFEISQDISYNAIDIAVGGDVINGNDISKRIKNLLAFANLAKSKISNLIKSKKSHLAKAKKSDFGKPVLLERNFILPKSKKSSSNYKSPLTKHLFSIIKI